MNSSYEENEVQNSTLPVRKKQSALYLQAGLTGILVGFTATAVLTNFLPESENLSDWASIWLGLVPFHIAGLSCAIAVIASNVPAKALMQWLDLTGVRAVKPLVEHAGKILLWVYPASALLTFVAAQILAHFDYEPAGSMLINILLQKNDLSLWVSMAFIAIFVAPVTEELLFRLFLYEMLKTWSRLGALVLTALIFSVMHGIPEQAPALFLLGIVLQKERERHQNLWAPILIHSVFNTLSFCILLLVSQADVPPM